MGQRSPLAALRPPRQLAALAGWTPRASALGCYIHVPFCTVRCGYCSFNTAPHDTRAVPRFVAAVCAEIDLAASSPWARAVELATVFLGGGTPSLLSPDELHAILHRLATRFRVAPGAEITVECNPESATRERLAAYRALGVTRISLGVQTLDDALLPVLDRQHTAAGARAAYDAARAADFPHVSVDVMYGVPGAPDGAWERTVAELLAWDPDHLSAYGLTLDEGSLWHAAGGHALPPDDRVTAEYWHLAERARAAGFEHYEVSNYARSGHRSAHNQMYWRAGEYIALGPGACGFLGQVRYSNHRAVPRYCGEIEAGDLPVASHETLTARQMLGERLFLGLRTADGIPDAWLEERLALGPASLARRLDDWVERGLLERGVPEAGAVELGGVARARLTEAGFLLSDALFAELL